MKEIFDFERLKQYVKNNSSKMLFDSMSGGKLNYFYFFQSCFWFNFSSIFLVTGPYVRKIFVEELGLPETCLMNTTPSEDFNGI